MTAREITERSTSTRRELHYSDTVALSASPLENNGSSGENAGMLAAAQRSGGSAGVLAGTIAGVAALVLALSGAARYARRRLR